MLAISDAALGVMGAVIVAVISTFGVVAAAAISRSAKAEAKEATESCDEVRQELAEAQATIRSLHRRIELLRGSEDDCLDSLAWAWQHISALQQLAGIPVADLPPSVTNREQRRTDWERSGADFDEEP